MGNDHKEEDKTVVFTSSHILLEIAKEEYTKERERANALDNKASFFITVLVAVMKSLKITSMEMDS